MASGVKAALLFGAALLVCGATASSDGRTAMVLLLALSALLLAAAQSDRPAPAPARLAEGFVAAGTPVCQEAGSGVCKQVPTEDAASRGDDRRCKYIMHALNKGACGAYTSTGYAFLDEGAFGNRGGAGCSNVLPDDALTCFLPMTHPIVMRNGVNTLCSMENDVLRGPDALSGAGYDSPVRAVGPAGNSCAVTFKELPAGGGKAEADLRAWLDALKAEADKRRCADHDAAMAAAKTAPA